MIQATRKGGEMTERVAAFIAQGLMADAGRRVVEAAQRDGSLGALDAVEDLRTPDDLAGAGREPASRVELQRVRAISPEAGPVVDPKR